MQLLVVTYTGGNRPEELQRCKNSVAAQNVHHTIIEYHGPADRLIEARRAALKDGYIAFVDDDDIVIQNSLNLCAAALDATGAGVAFTDEIHVSPEGRHLYKVDGPRHYLQISDQPAAFHHLMVFNAAKVPDLELYIEGAVGTEWLLFASTAFESGAIHVPILGYEWTLNPKTIRRQGTTSGREEMIRRIAERYPSQDLGRIPQYLG